jgi:hypothetical protein
MDSPKTRKRFQVALTLSKGHGTPLTALMSPKRSSSCTPARPGQCQDAVCCSLPLLMQPGATAGLAHKL